MVEFPIFKVDFSNLAKLFRRGKIDVVYNKMYSTACELAVFETRKFASSFKEPNHTNVRSAMEAHFDKVSKYQQRRIAHHMNEMKDLLRMHLELEKK